MEENSKTKRLGLLINDAYSDYEIELTQGVLSCCTEKGYSLLVFPVEELNTNYSPYSYQKRSITAFATENNIDGLVMASAVLGNFVDKEELFNYLLTQFSVPKVSIGIDIPGITSIVVDPSEGFKALIENLIVKHQCKKFALIDVMKGNIDGQERSKIFFDTLKEHEIPFNHENIMTGRFTYDTAKEAIEKFYKEKGHFDFDAVVCLNDDMAFACIDFCKQHSIIVPDELKIVGFDDDQRSSYELPRLSSINQQIHTQGYKAAEALINIIEGNEVPHKITVPTQARFRQTCGCIDITNTYINYVDTKNVKYLFDPEKNTSKMSEWLIKKPQVQKLKYLNSSLQVKMDLNQLRKDFIDNFKNFDVHAAALVLYETPVSMPELFYNFPIPEKAYLVSAYDEDNNYSMGSNEEFILFNPQKTMLPGIFFSKSKKRQYIYPITDADLQFGYMIYSFGSYDEMVYSFMNSIYSRIISSAYETFKLEQARQLLEEKNKSLNVISTTDELTSLLNRRGFTTFGQQAIDLALRIKSSGLVIFGDMDGLKFINDNFGHDMGDIAIKEEARILKTSFRNSDIVGRLGGDEFAIVAPGLSPIYFQRIKKTIDEKCEDFNKNSGYPFTLSISIGYAEFNQENYYLYDILHKADILLYEEKKRKKNVRR